MLRLSNAKAIFVQGLIAQKGLKAVQRLYFLGNFKTGHLKKKKKKEKEIEKKNTGWVQKNGPPCDKSVRYAGCFLMSSIFWLKN